MNYSIETTAGSGIFPFEGGFAQYGLMPVDPYTVDAATQVDKSRRDTNVLIATSNPHRLDAIHMWVEKSGLPNTSFLELNGWEAEPGSNALEKAGSKAMRTLLEALKEGIIKYKSLTLVIAADAIGRGPGWQIREKPLGSIELLEFEDEWLRAAHEQYPVITEAGTCVLAVHNNQIARAGVLTHVGVLPTDPNHIRHIFQLPPSGTAYGYGGIGAVISGKAIPFMGGVNNANFYYNERIDPYDAVERIDGVHQEFLEAVVAGAVKQFNLT